MLVTYTLVTRMIAIYTLGAAMFVGRERELESLQRLYASNSFQFGVVYGRRRVGKTKLLRQFTTDKPDVIFFTAHETTLS